MFCPKCGAENPDTAKFCGKCGAPMAVAAAAPDPAPTPSSAAASSVTAPAPTPVGDGMKYGIIAGTLIIPLIGIIMGAIYMRDPQEAKKSVGKLWLGVGVGMLVFWMIVNSGEF